MRRRYENGTRFWRATDALGDIDAMLVDRDRANLRTRRNKRKASQRVSGILDPDFLVRPLHNTDKDIEGLLRARSDHDLFGLAPHRTRGLEIIANGFAQFEHPVRIGIAKVMPAEGTQAACAEFSPQLGGACIHQRAPQIERALVALRRHIDEAAKLPRGGCRFGG